MEKQARHTNEGYSAAVTAVERRIGGRTYLVKSVFADEASIAERLFDICEKKALREMGMN